MAYEKQNFKNGEILPADKLNHIEDGIVDLENSQAKIDDLNITTDKAWSSRRIIDTLCPPLEETGNPVTCYPVTGYSLGCKVSWEPTQEGSGDPSPDNVRPIKGRDSVTVTRCGETLWSLNKITLQMYNSIITTKIDMDAVNLLPRNVKLYFSGECSNGTLKEIRFFDGIGAEIGVLCANGRPNTGLKSGNIAVVRLYAGLNENSERTCTNLQITLATTAPTTYTPYTGQTATLTLPRTIYGGTVDAVTGEGQETWKLIDSYAGEDLPGKWISDRNVYASGTTPTTGAQVAYILAEPISFTATGAKPITALSGVNTVLTGAGSATVTGRAMPEKNRNQNLSTDILFKYPRTGKVYTVKIPKFTSNPTTVCEKLDDNTGLVCEASTDTIEGRDDYAEIPLFKWYNCNYKRDENGHAYPIAIEGFDDNYTTSGNIDVGVIQMTPFVKWDDSNDDYIILSITDNPTEGYRAWSTARVGGEVYPYVIHSKYISSLGTDGLLHSIPNAKPERKQSYNNMITNYAKKGSGYKGSGVERNTWQIIFTLIKYANKSSQNIFAGTTGYSFQYSASIQSAEKHTYFPVTNAQAANIIIGSYVSVGYAYKTSDTATNLDRGYDTVHSYADSVKVLKIEDLDDSNKAVYLDVKEGFDTIQHEYSDTLSAPITLTSIHWYSGSTDSVMGRHDGSFVNNNNGKYPYRVQGVEYAVGGYTVASDTVIVFTDNNEKDVYVSPSNIAHSSADATIKSNYKNVGHIPSGEWWIGDIGFDTDTNATWPTVRGSGNATGVGDYNYGSTGNNGVTREYLQGGGPGFWSRAGSSYLRCRNGLGNAYWDSLSAD